MNRKNFLGALTGSLVAVGTLTATESEVDIVSVKKGYRGQLYTAKGKPINTDKYQAVEANLKTGRVKYHRLDEKGELVVHKNGKEWILDTKYFEAPLKFKGSCDAI